MTKFEELLDIITHNKNKSKKIQSAAANQENEIIEVAGAESTKNPLITFGDEETDPGLLEELRRSPNKPLQGWGSDSWD